MKPDTFIFLLGFSTGGVVVALLLLWWFLTARAEALTEARNRIRSAYRTGYDHGIALKPYLPPVPSNPTCRSTHLSPFLP